MERAAFLDLGTNTFHLLIAERKDKAEPVVLYKESLFVKIGEGGISQSLIVESAIERAVETLKHYRTKIEEFGVEKVLATATSALRSAKNGNEVLERFKNEADIQPKIIDGDKEATLIYEGVKSGLIIGEEKVLVMDIGGGSVEFIIGDGDAIYWKQSFEMGAQRLYDKFHSSEPISAKGVEALGQYAKKVLEPLWEAIDEHEPKRFIGASGTFKTLRDIDKGVFGNPRQEVYTISNQSFKTILGLFLEKDREERLAIPGMIEKRVDMIVTATVLADLVLKAMGVEGITVSDGALKEGLMKLYFTNFNHPVLQGF